MANIFKINSVTTDDITDPEYRFTYSNTLGHKMHIYRDRIETLAGRNSCSICINDLVDVKFSPLWKRQENDAYVILVTKEVEHNFVVDTYTEGFPDLPLLVRTLQRRLDSGK